MIRASHGRHTDMENGLVTDTLRSSCFRGTPVERAGVCSSVVRSAFVRRSVASCVAFVLCWFVWRSCAADSPRACDGLLTGGGRAGIRLMPTFCDIPRWAAARGGLATDGKRTRHGLHTDDSPRTDNGRQTDRQRTSDGRRTGGHSSDADILRHSEMGGGAAADCTRTRHGHATGLSRTIPLRTGNGRHTGLPTGF